MELKTLSPGFFCAHAETGWKTMRGSSGEKSPEQWLIENVIDRKHAGGDWRVIANLLE